MDDLQLQRLMDKLGELTNALGRGATGQTGGVNQPNRPSGTASGGSSAKPKSSGAESLLDARMRKYADELAKGKKLSESARKELEEWEKTQKKVNKVQEESEDRYNSVNRNLKYFGQNILNEGASLSSAMRGLSSGLSGNSTLMGKALGGMAAGFGFTLGVLENFAASAKDMGAFADHLKLDQLSRPS
jgi:hypothetical protein